MSPLDTLSKNQKVAVFVSVVFIGLFFIIPSFELQDTFSTMDPTGSFDDIDLNSFSIFELRDGMGVAAESGDTLTVHYEGRLTDGTVFDSSYEGNPFSFILGEGGVILGWDQGLLGMKKDGIRLLIIPPEYGYGENTIGPIPGGSTLIFEVELLDIRKADE